MFVKCFVLSLSMLAVAAAAPAPDPAISPTVRVWPEVVFAGNPYSVTVNNFQPKEPIRVEAEVLCADGTKESIELAKIGGPDKHGAAHVELPAEGCAGAYSVTVTQGRWHHKIRARTMFTVKP